jgi:hypothetical protein
MHSECWNQLESCSGNGQKSYYQRGDTHVFLEKDHKIFQRLLFLFSSSTEFEVGLIAAEFRFDFCRLEAHVPSAKKVTKQITTGLPAYNKASLPCLKSPHQTRAVSKRPQKPRTSSLKVEQPGVLERINSDPKKVEKLRITS